MPPPHHTTLPTTRGELTSTTIPTPPQPTPSGELTFTPHTTQKNTHQHFHTIRHPKEHYRQQATITQNSLQPPHTNTKHLSPHKEHTPSTTLMTTSVVDKHQKTPFTMPGGMVKHYQGNTLPTRVECCTDSDHATPQTHKFVVDNPMTT